MSLNHSMQQVYKMLGLSENMPLPDMPATLAPDGVQYRIIPKDPNRRMHLRLQYLCKSCDKWIPCGRAKQHIKRDDHRLEV